MKHLLRIQKYQKFMDCKVIQLVTIFEPSYIFEKCTSSDVSYRLVLMCMIVYASS